MKVQLTTTVEMSVTMEVEVTDNNEDTIKNAMEEVMSDTGTNMEHESIVEVERTEYTLNSHTSLEEEPLPDKYHFSCGKCKKVHHMSQYAVAQLASGHILIHTCDQCNNKTDLEPEMID